MRMNLSVIWPTSGTGADLAKVLRAAATEDLNRLSGLPADIVAAYLTWVTGGKTVLAD